MTKRVVAITAQRQVGLSVATESSLLGRQAQVFSQGLAYMQMKQFKGVGKENRACHFYNMSWPGGEQEEAGIIGNL